MKRALRIPLAVLALVVGPSGCSPNVDGERVASFRLVDSDGVPALPAWVGFRDGEGAWRRLVAADADGRWTVEVTDPAGRYAFAVVAASGEAVSVYAGTLAEVTRFQSVAFEWPEPAAPLAVSGAVTGLSAGSSWVVGVGSRVALPASAGAALYAVGVRAPGTYDVLASRADASGAKTGLWVRRDLAIAGNLEQAVSFDDPQYGLAGEVAKVPVTGGTLTEGRVSLFTTSMAPVGWLVPAASSASGAPELRYLAVPQGRSRGSDVLCASGQIPGVELARCAAPGGDLTLDFSGLGPFDSGTLAGRTFTWAAQPSARAYNASLTATGAMAYYAMVTAGYAGASPSFTIPELSAVDGGNPGWSFVSTGATKLALHASGGSLSLDAQMEQEPHRGLEPGDRVWWAMPPGANAPRNGVCDDCDNCVADASPARCLSWCRSNGCPP